MDNPEQDMRKANMEELGRAVGVIHDGLEAVSNGLRGPRTSSSTPPMGRAG